MQPGGAGRSLAFTPGFDKDHKKAISDENGFNIVVTEFVTPS